MKNIQPELILKIWQKGKPLGDAIWEYCDRQYHDAYPYQPEIIDRDSIIESTTGYRFYKPIVELVNHSHTQNQYNEESKQAFQNMAKNVFDKIKRGKLIAIGFREPIKSDFPILIPVHMWPPKNFDTEESRILAYGVNFVQIHILKKNIVEKIISNETPRLPKIKIGAGNLGRPSRKKEIMEAYELLKNKNRIEYDKPFISHVPLIQETIFKLNPDTNNYRGIQEEAIRRAVGEDFQKKKESL